MSTDLSALTAAADRWDGMAGELEKQETAYRREVHCISMGPSWTGLSADAAHARFDATLKEYRSAQTEARAVASLLRDAHSQFSELRGRLKAACAEAVEAGMRVSERGVVSPDPGRTKGREGDDAHAGAPESGERVRAWQERIDKAVRDVTDADTGVRIALTAATAPDPLACGGRGFNGGAVGDVETYEALQAERALEKLARGGQLSDGEIAELQRTFRDNSGDEAFARTLLDDLGAAGTIRLTNELNDLVHVDGGRRASAFGSIETGLADALATATKDTTSEWYRHWRAEMRQAGVQHYATDAQGARMDKAVGYQSLVTLMRKGHGYAPGMLEDLTDDMISAERRDPGVWRLKGEYAGRRDGWFANDPVDGMLGLMSRDPATAAHYLGSDAHMKYLVKERDWDVTLHERENGKAAAYTARPDGDDRAGFGAALQAATTGIDPADRHAHYAAHTARNEAVLRSALTHLSDQGDDFPPSLREPMAKILVNHGGTVHRSMSEIDIAHSPLKQDQLFEVVKQVSKDKDAYGTLNGGLNQAMVTGIHDDHSDSTEPLIRAGRTVGFLEEARIQAQGDPKTAEFTAKPLFDRAIGYIPVASDDVQEGFDYVTEKWLEDEQKRLDEKQADDNIKAYDTRNSQLMGLAEEWSKTRRAGAGTAFDAKTEIGRSAQDGMAHATGVSGEPSK
ncbi:WXG100 family type VII secretion target [Streptomyces sp. NPDC003697]